MDGPGAILASMLFVADGFTCVPHDDGNWSHLSAWETMIADQWLSNNRHGAQGTYDEASNSVLDNEFGTHVDEDVIKQILEKGTLQESTVGNPAFSLAMLNTNNLLSRCPNARDQRMIPRVRSPLTRVIRTSRDAGGNSTGGVYFAHVVIRFRRVMNVAFTTAVNWHPLVL